MVARLQSGLGADETQIYRVESPLDLSELLELASLDRPELKVEPWIPAIPPRLAAAQADLPARSSTRSAAATSLVHQPYGSFIASFEVFAQAAVRDPNVIAMKTAVYRTSDDSVLVGSLIQCAEEGKQSVCLVELKARFDELRNIEWSRALEQAGVHVAYGFPDLKIHAKMTLIVRREGDALRRYAHIGTGNYHAATARLYEDIGIFTADEEITADVADLFNYITGFGRPQKFRKLLVAPFTLRSGLVDEIRRVATAAAEGKHARIRLKLNHLVDPKIVEELYAASRAGATSRHHRPLDVCSPSRRGGALREHPRPLDRRALPRAQPDLLLRGGRAGCDATSAARTSCSGTSTTVSRCSCPSKTPAHVRRSMRSSTARSPTTRTPGSSTPRASGRGSCRRNPASRTRITTR